ncbi:MAG: copper-translocating P-type ATPase [Clostridiales bacterium]|nr:copper-translocating P-type ATPase [Clostridiales bacterium]
MKEESYKIGGMHCAACSSAVERVTRKLEGVERSDVNLPLNRMTIVYDESRLSPDKIISKIEKAGFTAELINGDGSISQRKTDDSSDKALISERRELVVACILSVILLYVSMGSMMVSHLPLPEILSMHSHPVNFAMFQMLLSVPIMFIGRRFFIGGFRSLINKNPNMDALVAVSCTASFLFSVVTTFQLSDNPGKVHSLYYESAAIVITLVLLGKHLESNSKEKTKSAIVKLMELTPDTAILIRDNRQWEVPTETLKVGDIVLVKPGAKIPLDGIVKSGEGSVNEAMLTGESMPVEKAAGSEVIGGSINVSGALYVEITRIGQDTTLSKIIKFVEDAQNKKAPISKVADKVAGIFVPIVIAVALLSAAVWLAAGESFAFALKIFTSVLVIACPCAMGLATPTAIIVGTGLGASHGILIRSGEALETTHKTNVVVLDKTGTVTEGKPRVTEIVSDILSDSELIDIAFAAESLSEHPLAKAIADEANSRGFLNEKAIASFENVPGMGIKAFTKEGQPLCVGNIRLMESEGISTEKYASDISRLAGHGQTPMLVAFNGILCGVIGVADTVKDTSKEAVEKLRAMGIKTVLLTGDNRAAASYIGGIIGTDDVIAEVLPGDKAAVIEKLQQDGSTVMMVGDGINDAPALAMADIGCAIGSGSDIAIESADIVLMKNNLTDVAGAIKLSRLTIRNIKQNLFWAFCYNTLGIPIAAGVLYPKFGLLLSPMIGALAMSLSSVFVVTNALRLRGKKI